MSGLTTFYTGQDIDLVIETVDYEFDDLIDAVVEVYNNEGLKKTCKKTEADDGKKVIAVDDSPTQFRARVFETEVADFVDGHVRVAVTFVVADDDYPEGRHIKHYITLARFQTL